MRVITKEEMQEYIKKYKKNPDSCKLPVDKIVCHTETEYTQTSYKCKKCKAPIMVTIKMDKDNQRTIIMFCRDNCDSTKDVLEEYKDIEFLYG